MTKRISRLWGEVVVVLGLSVGVLPVLATPVNSLVISEVFYDRPGSDSGFEWVEVFNGTPLPINLSGFSLGFGGNDYSSATLGLNGTVDGGDYFVLGGPFSDATNGSPFYQLVVDFSPDLQNAASVADGVALFNVLANQIVASSIPIDAVIYGGANDNQLVDADGQVVAPMVADAASGASIERISVTGWTIAPQPSPGTGALNVAALPGPATLPLFALGLCSLLLACPRMRISQGLQRVSDVLQGVLLRAYFANR